MSETDDRARGTAVIDDDRPSSGEWEGAQAVARPRHEKRSSRRSRRRARRLARRWWFGRHPVLAGLIVVILALTPVWVSIGETVSNPAYGSSVVSRFAEWVREHGGNSIVISIENLWYSHHQPPVGGKPAKGLIPAAASGTTPRIGRGVDALAPPTRIQPIAHPALAGEGVWHPAGRRVDGVPAVYEAYLRPDAIHTSLVVGVAWIDTKLVKATLYSGSIIPGGGPYRFTAPISPTAAKTLIAAFNAGFLMDNANGGYYTDGRAVIPLRNGAASFVVYKNGSATVAQWGRDAHMTSQVASVRQNLDLLVDHGKPVPGLQANDTTKWGYTLGNQVYVWRSALGITRNGALVYVGGPGLNITSLADVLVRAGAVRAMELDINTDWVNFTTYRPATAQGEASPANGTELLAAMVGTPARYFESYWARDFIAISSRSSIARG